MNTSCWYSAFLSALNRMKNKRTLYSEGGNVEKQKRNRNQQYQQNGANKRIKYCEKTDTRWRRLLVLELAYKTNTINQDPCWKATFARMVTKFSFFTTPRLVIGLIEPVNGRRSMSDVSTAISASYFWRPTLALACNLSLSNQVQKTREEMVFTVTLEFYLQILVIDSGSILSDFFFFKESSIKR